MQNESMVIEERHNGPSGSANGGYACGLFAVRAAGLLGVPEVTVTLHSPPAMGTRLTLQNSGRRVHVFDGSQLVAVASPSRQEIDPPEFVDTELARACERTYRGLTDHPFPSCFVCGTAPEHPDALTLAPGQIPGRPAATACTWTPKAVAAGLPVPEALAWAALDCPGGWTVDLSAEPMVLSRMTARFESLPLAGRPHVVVGRMDERDGRTMTTSAALYQQDGRRLGASLSLWVELDPDVRGR